MLRVLLVCVMLIVISGCVSKDHIKEHVSIEIEKDYNYFSPKRVNTYFLMYEHKF